MGERTFEPKQPWNWPKATHRIIGSILSVFLLTLMGQFFGCWGIGEIIHGKCQPDDCLSVQR